MLPLLSLNPTPALPVLAPQVVRSSRLSLPEAPEEDRRRGRVADEGSLSVASRMPCPHLAYLTDGCSPR